MPEDIPYEKRAPYDDGPYHMHDCSRCLYLGSRRIAPDFFDYYYCPPSHSLVARYGWGANYTSVNVKVGDYWRTTTHKPLQEARRLAIARGLLCPDHGAECCYCRPRSDHPESVVKAATDALWCQAYEMVKIISYQATLPKESQLPSLLSHCRSQARRYCRAYRALSGHPPRLAPR